MLSGTTAGWTVLTTSGRPAICFANHKLARMRAPLTAGPQSSPNKIPEIPPAKLNTVVSTRNCRMISRRLAPKARRIPISRVRSVTVASMIFMIPIPPTSKEMAAIIPMKAINMARVVRACSSSSSGTTTATSSMRLWPESASSTNSAVRLTSETSRTLNVI